MALSAQCLARAQGQGNTLASAHPLPHPQTPRSGRAGKGGGSWSLEPKCQYYISRQAGMCMRTSMYVYACMYGRQAGSRQDRSHPPPNQASPRSPLRPLAAQDYGVGLTEPTQPPKATGEQRAASSFLTRGPAAERPLRSAAYTQSWSTSSTPSASFLGRWRSQRSAWREHRDRATLWQVPPPPNCMRTPPLELVGLGRKTND